MRGCADRRNAGRKALVTATTANTLVSYVRRKLSTSASVTGLPSTMMPASGRDLALALQQDAPALVALLFARGELLSRSSEVPVPVEQLLGVIRDPIPLGCLLAQLSQGHLAVAVSPWVLIVGHVRFSLIW
jgi:hypothetical protein